ncbi:Hexose transporter-like protein [Paramyrothecium foliicola]|nr:Hexose transporter-like protein [Paramyrothecium foliicola]
MKRNGMMTVTFDHLDPSSEKARHDGGRRSAAGWDYSPLPRVTMRSFTMGVLVSMGGLIRTDWLTKQPNSFGYDTGQISGFLEMPDFLERFGEIDDTGERHFSTIRSGLIVALLSIGTLIGALAAAPLADAIGRRISISIWCIVTSIGFLIQIAAIRAWYQVMIGRLVAGFGVGALSLLVPMYQAETAPPWIRGALVCTYQLFITLGIFLAACFNYATVQDYPNSSASWRIVVGLGWIWTLILGVGILFFPETPRYDFRHGQGERAEKTLCRVYGASHNHHAIRSEVKEIVSKLDAEKAIMAQTSSMSEFFGMFKAPRMTYRILLGMILQMFQQLSGANYFLYYGVTIFSAVSIDSFITQIILNTINFLATFPGLYMVEKFGRRKSLIAGSLWMFVCFMIFASVGYFLFDENDLDGSRTPGIIMIVFAALFFCGFATTWGPMIWAIQAEIFPSRYRAKGMALSTASNWTWNFCIGFFTPFITNDIGFAYGYVFAGCNLVAALIVYFFVIEGTGRTLEEIDTMYLQRVKPWKSSKWVPPSQDEMERIRREAGISLEAAPVGGSGAAGEDRLSGDTHIANDSVAPNGHAKKDSRDVAHNEHV